jgi:hypothetical protein
MKHSSLTIGILAVISPLLLIAAFLLPNSRDARLAWQMSQYSKIERPLIFLQSLSEAMTGRSEARRDIRAGHLALKTSGARGLADGIYAELLSKRLGVTLSSVAGSAYYSVVGWEAYNEEMQIEIARRFGKEALLNVWKDTDRIVRERRRRGLL